MTNGCSLANEINTDSFLKVSDKQLTIRQLYALLKSRKELAFNRDIPHACAKLARIYSYYQKESPRPPKLHWQTMFSR